MERQKYCVYNQTRECFLSLGLPLTDISLARLKSLIGGSALKFDEGLWVAPLRGIRSLGVLFPLDLVYLDEQYRVIEAVESLSTARKAPVKVHAATVLALPSHTIYSSQTQPGDQLLICVVEEMEHLLAAYG